MGIGVYISVLVDFSVVCSWLGIVVVVAITDLFSKAIDEEIGWCSFKYY